MNHLLVITSVASALLFQPQVASAAVAESPGFRTCMLQGLVAYGTAREAVKGKKKDYWKLQPQTSDYQYSFLDELYKRIDEEGFKDYMLFGSEKLLQCVQEEQKVKLPEPTTLTPCFAQIDVVFHARQYKAGGGGLAGTRRFARNYLKDEKVYPQAMLDRILPIAFSEDNPEKLADLREDLIRQCALPKLSSQ